MGTKRTHWPTILYVLSAYSVFIYGQTIQISHFRQDSETKCPKGLLSGATVVLKAVINYQMDPNLKYVHIYIRKKMDILPFVKVYNLQDDCTNNMTCCQRIDTYRAVITINVNVTKADSEAKIYGKLLTTQSTEVVSEIQYFPKIYDYSDINSILNVNGKNISTKEDDCVISLDVPEVILYFSCESHISPCLIEISSTDSTKLIQRNKSAAYIASENKLKDIDVTIRYGVCRLDKTPFVIRCKLKTDKKSCTELNLHKDPKSNSDDPLFYNIYSAINLSSITLVIIITGVVAVLASIWCLYKRNHKNQKNGDEQKVPITKEGLPVSNLKLDNSNIEEHPLIELDKKEHQKATTKFLKDFKCDTNPEHESFYSVHEFQLAHINLDYKLEILYKLIKNISQLTVSVLVSFKSQARYKFQKTAVNLCPDYLKNEKKGFRLKTGMIISVDTILENDASQCPCETCKISGTPSSSWGKVFVLTSSTVVFDNNEAQKSSFNLFYNSHNSDATTLYGRGVSEFNLEEGWCIVECATCDARLLEKLDNLIIICSNIMKKINTELNGKMKGDFVFIVSHPHDFPKQITIGKCEKRKVSKMTDTIEQTSYQYSTPTCHGSAGAFVYILGVSDISAKQFHVHLGVNALGENYCSIGKENI